MANTTLIDSYADEEDYIDMELTSSPFFTNSSPQNREFEFQMTLSTNDKHTTTSPADELFYKGKLLPLHIPPRRQMVANLLLLHQPTTTTTNFDIDHQEYYHTAPCTHTTNTPLDSCNISPSESCRVSCELNPDEHFFQWSNELNSFINNHNQNHPTKKSWSKKLKMIKSSVFLSQKLKSSKAYLKSFFTKSNCSDEPSCSNPNISENLPKLSQESSNKHLLNPNDKKKPFGEIGKAAYPTIASIIKNIDKEGIGHDVHRRSFSGAIKWHSPALCLSSSSSSNSSSGASSNSSSFSINSNHELRRSTSATEIEGSIEAAIAHCKKSQKLFDERDNSSSDEIGEVHCSLSGSRIDCGGDQKRPGLCTS